MQPAMEPCSHRVKRQHRSAQRFVRLQLKPCGLKQGEMAESPRFSLIKRVGNGEVLFANPALFAPVPV